MFEFISMLATLIFIVFMIYRSHNNQQRARQEQERQVYYQEHQRQEVARIAALEREAIRAAKEEEKLRKEQERQAAVLAKHEEQLAKLENRLAIAERELQWNREQRDRLFELLDIEELEREASIPGGKEWQKHHKKIISYENQIHTIQKRIDKYTIEQQDCKNKLSA